MAEQTVTLRIKSDATGLVASVDQVESKTGELGGAGQPAGLDGPVERRGSDGL